MIVLKSVLVVVAVTIVQGTVSIPLSASKEVHPYMTLVSPWYNYSFVQDQPAMSHNAVDLICKRGVWVIYGGQNYTASTYVQIFYSLSENCEQSMDPYVGSARVAGVRPDVSVPSVTFYSQITLQGESLAIENQMDNIGINTRSFANINAPQIELFENTNYGGDSFCFDTALSQCGTDNDGTVCWMWNWDGDIPYYAESAKSARVGCNPATNVYKSKPRLHQGPSNVMRM